MAQGHGTPGDALSVRAMVAAVAALGATLSKSQVDRDYKEGAPRHSPRAFLAWRAAFRELGRTADSRIDRPQDSRPPPAPPADDPPAESSPSAGGEAAELVDEHTLAFRRDRATNERIKAERAQLELEQLRGDVVSLRDSEELHFTAARITRDRVLMVVPRVSADLHALVLTLVPEELRADLAKRLSLHEFERRLEAAQRQALDEAAKAIADDDDDPHLND